MENLDAYVEMMSQSAADEREKNVRWEIYLSLNGMYNRKEN